MNNYITSAISEFNIDKNKDKIIMTLCNYIDTLIFNIVSIASIITMLNNSKSINMNAVQLVKKYIADNCNKKIKGGTSLPSEYFGYNSGIYNENNNINDILTVDFNSGVLRPQIGGGGRGKKMDNEWLIKKIKDLLIYYNLKASNKIINSLMLIIYSNINCLLSKLHDNKNKVLTVTTINKIIKLNKNLDIFK